MEVFKIQGTGLKAVGLIAASFAIWVVLTGPRFSRLCGDMDEVAKSITFDISTAEMRHLAADTQGKTTAQLEAQFDMAKRTDQLHVVITALKCADTFVMGIVCRAHYRLGTDDNAGPPQEEWFRMLRSGKSESWFDYLGPKKLLFRLSPRSCTRE
jgi:hypothetical protein